MKPYLITYTFYYDGKRIRTRSHTLLCNSIGENIECCGTDFEGLWDLKSEWGYVIPINAYENKKGKRSICLDGELKSITPKNCKPWRFTVTKKETTISMRGLMEFNTEDVIQYLKERGITACPILK